MDPAALRNRLFQMILIGYKYRQIHERVLQPIMTVSITYCPTVAAAFQLSLLKDYGTKQRKVFSGAFT